MGVQVMMVDHLLMVNLVQYNLFFLVVHVYAILLYDSNLKKKTVNFFFKFNKKKLFLPGTKLEHEIHLNLILKLILL